MTLYHEYCCNYEKMKENLEKMCRESSEVAAYVQVIKYIYQINSKFID